MCQVSSDIGPEQSSIVPAAPETTPGDALTWIYMADDAYRNMQKHLRRSVVLLSINDTGRHCPVGAFA
jgi:hypothetical protein